MIKNNTLSKLAQATAGLGLIAALGVIAAPAQAALINGSLATSDGNTDFFGAFGVPGNLSLPASFPVIFSPNSLGSSIFVTTATGQFDPFFSTPDVVVDVVESNRTSDFNLIGGTIGNFTYSNASPITFTLNGVVKTIVANSTFTGSVTDDGVVLGLNPTTSQASTVFIPGANGGNFTFFDPEKLITGLAFSFNDSPATGGGSWSANVDVLSNIIDPTNVPEPSALVGLLAITGLAFGLKGKKA